jgi:hypothetical protein
MLFEGRMKRLIQCAAFLVAALLGTQPALAGLTCTMRVQSPAHCAFHCPRAMSRMAPDCPMANQAGGTACLQDCCKRVPPQAIVRSSDQAKPRFALAIAILAPSLDLPSAFASSALREPHASIPSGLERHVLLRVFRI